MSVFLLYVCGVYVCVMCVMCVMYMCLCNVYVCAVAIKRDSMIAEWADEHGIRIITEEDYTLYPMGTILKQGRPIRR